VKLEELDSLTLALEVFKLVDLFKYVSDSFVVELNCRGVVKNASRCVVKVRYAFPSVFSSCLSR